MGKRLTHEEFMKKFYAKNKSAENIEILGEYVNSRTKIKCKCKIDGYEWEATPNSLLSGRGCPKCSGKVRKNTEYFINEMKEINDNIEILGEYVNSRTKIKCKCKLDGYEWKARPNSLLMGTGCPKCYGNANKTTEEFKQEIKEINDNIEILGKYTNDRTKIKVRCKLDGYEWEATPNNLLSGQGCPKCDESKGEKRVAEYLDSKNIEYDGEDHYMFVFRGKGDTYEKAFNRFIGTKVRDTIKTVYCKKNNIKLIRIPYWDFDSIEEILEKEL